MGGVQLFSDPGGAGPAGYAGEENQRTVPVCAVGAGTGAAAGAGAAVYLASGRHEHIGGPRHIGEIGGTVNLCAAGRGCQCLDRGRWEDW